MARLATLESVALRITNAGQKRFEVGDALTIRRLSGAMPLPNGVVNSAMHLLTLAQTTGPLRNPADVKGLIAWRA